MVEKSRNMVKKCRNYGVNNIFLSGIVFTTRVSLDILIQVHNKISTFCNTNGLYYIDNRHIRADCLYKDGLHLIDKGKIVLANNFIINLNQNFLTHTSSTRCLLNQVCISKPTSNPIEADQQILQEDRIKFHNNPLLGYLNINSPRNKVTDLRIIFKGLSLDYFVLSEIKLDESFPTAQFTLEGYEIRSRKDRDKYGRGLIEFVKNGFICKTI